jgi:hypothetical protein
MTIERREFLRTAALTAGGAALGAAGAAPAAAAGTNPSRSDGLEGEYRLFVTRPLPPARPARGVEVLFRTPFPRANGMQATAEGLWIVDPSDGASHVYLLSYSGEVIRHFPTDGDTPSGMTFDGETLWLASTYSREIIRVDPWTGETIARYFTPGAGVIFNMPGDPTSRRSPLSPIRTDPAAAGAPAQPQPSAPGSGGGGGQRQPGAYREGTGGHGMEWRNGRLWLATPPARMIYRIDPDSWTVEHMFPSVDKRPHGIGFEGDHLWESDSDHSTFYKRDPETGEVLDVIRLSDADPIPHGMTVWDGYIWWCDDVTNNSHVCRMRL